MLDATKSDEQRRLLEIELDAVGIRRMVPWVPSFAGD
jgi:hypothetical protein